MYFSTKNYLKSTCNYTDKHALCGVACGSPWETEGRDGDISERASKTRRFLDFESTHFHLLQTSEQEFLSRQTSFLNTLPKHPSGRLQDVVPINITVVFSNDNRLVNLMAIIARAWRRGLAHPRSLPLLRDNFLFFFFFSIYILEIKEKASAE